MYVVLSTEVSDYMYEGFASWRKDRFNTLKAAIEHLESVGVGGGDFYSYLGVMEKGELLILRHSKKEGLAIELGLTSDEVTEHFDIAFGSVV